MSAIPITLKQSQRRSVRVERTPHSDAACEVVKSFHGRGFLARALDRRRAEREFALLDGLWREGFPVPRPIAVRESSRGAELSMEWIERAVTLDDVMHGRAAWPRPPELAARTLGALLARAHTLGLDHPDLHSGNVLLDAEGQGAWLVDLHAARRVARLGSKALLRDLITVAADTRELLSEGFRSRFWISYWKSIHVARGSVEPRPARAGAETLFAAPRTDLARTIEAAARTHRRRIVERSRLRWTRRSSVCAPFAMDGWRGFRSSALDDATFQVCLRMANRAVDAPASAARESMLVHGGAEQVVAIRASRARDMLACWYGTARLCEHNLACARPLVLTQSPRSWAAFAVPPDARSARETLPSLGLRERHVALDSIGELVGGFSDRGFALASLSLDTLWLAPDGRALFAPESGLMLREARNEERSHLAWAEDPRPLFRTIGITSATEAGVSLAAFVRAQRAGRDRRARIVEQLGG